VFNLLVNKPVLPIEFGTRSRGAGVLSSLRHLVYSNRLYTYTLQGPVPTRLFGTPPELILGDAAAGQSILSGNLLHGGQRWPFTDLAELSEKANQHWRAHVHGFDWLCDLRAVGSDSSRELARKYISQWIGTYTNWSPLAWKSDVLGQRLSNWLTHYGFFASSGSQNFTELFFKEVAQQARHLNRVVMSTTEGPARVRGLKGLIYCGVALPEREKYFHRGLGYLEAELNDQIFLDGGHCSRNPQVHAEVLADIISIRDTFVSAHIDVPDWLLGVVKRMVPMLRAFRHADGGLALFNGSANGDSSFIDMLLSKSKVKTRAISSAPHTGFHRLYAGRTTIIMDTGEPPNQTANNWGHAGTLAFEMSAEKDRIIVNCGMSRTSTLDWRQALRSTAAHSTIVVDDVNSSEINSAGGYSRKLGQVISSRREIDGSVIIEASYDGYYKLFGLIHRRLIMLSPDGAEFQGEDTLIGSGGHSYNLCFHLHPSVQATILRNKSSALIKPQRGSGWRFTCLDRSVALEESVYFDSDNVRRRSQQIVVFGPLNGAGASVKWRFCRI
jgi:uncharacterized heparinase superfamily protein